jgi:hypothetical protein
VVPTTEVVVFLSPATTTACAETCGATAATSASEAIASESPRVRVVADPAPWRTKPLVVEPGWTVRRLVPRLWIRSDLARRP